MRLKPETIRRALALGLTLAALPLFGTSATATPTPPMKIDFTQSILPIFKRSCFPCHATSLSDQPSVLPSPYFVKRQEVEAQHGQDDFVMGPQFPFPDDDTPKKQLDKMEKKLRRKLMPPKAQKKLKLGTALSDQDRGILLDWISQTRANFPN